MPPVDDASGTSKALESIGFVIGGVFTALGGRKVLAKLRGGGGSSETDYQAMARAFFAEKAAADEEHRDALAAEIRDLARVTREQHELTRAELRSANDATRSALGTLLQSYQALLVGVAAKVDVLILRNGGKP